MLKIAPFIFTLGLVGTPASAAQIYDISFDASSGYAGSFGLDTISDTLVSVDFVQGGRVWTLSDLVLSSSYVGSGVYYMIGGKPNGLSIQISPVATDPSQNDFSLSFTLLFGSPRTTQGGTFQAQTAGSGYSFTQDVTVKAAAVPELGSWAMMSFGLGAIGYALRARRKQGMVDALA